MTNHNERVYYLGFDNNKITLSYENKMFEICGKQSLHFGKFDYMINTENVENEVIECTN